MKRRYLVISVFSSGMVTLGAELAAARLLGSTFGTSNLVWASIIGLILIYLTVGYTIGGRWADMNPYPKAFFRLMVWAGFTIGLIPFFARPLLRIASDAFDQLQVGFLFGSFAVILILFIVPITLLGAISPFAIRLAMDDTEKAGQISGRIYAISTLGSFLGTFVPDLLLIPLFGTTWTYLILSLFLIGIALIAMAGTLGVKSITKYLWMPVVVLLLGLVWANAPIKQSEGQVYETESMYNYIQVVERNGVTMLRLNEGQGIHSMYAPDRLAFYGSWMQFLAAPFFNAPGFTIEDIDRIAIVGLAAGTSARQMTEAFGPVPIDGFEIDPKIIEVGKEYFDMNEPNLNSIAQDGRWGLEHSDYSYSIISIDAYRPPYIPWHLTTREFFQITYDKLEDDGVLAINIGRGPTDRRLIEALYSTISEVYPSLYVIDIPNTFNSILYATKSPSSIENFLYNYDLLLATNTAEQILLESLGVVIHNLQPEPAPGIVFTDDKSPVEWLINNMVLNFIFIEDPGVLQQ